jgi:hypothetical protein
VTTTTPATPPSTISLDAAALESRPGRYNRPELKCPQCRAWRQQLVIVGEGVVECWPCWKAGQEQRRGTR